MGKHGLHKVHHKAWEKHYDLPIKGVRTQKQMNRLIQWLNQDKDPTRRLQHLVYEIRKSPQAFSGDQVLTLAPFYSTNLLTALHLLDHHILGITCIQALKLMNMFSIPEQKLDVLKVCSEQITDPINRNILAGGFSYNIQPQVTMVLETMRGRSHVYGGITSERVIFLIDTSGSMGTTLRTDCGETFNRLEFVVHDLHKILHHRVSDDFKFNIITFSSYAKKWKTGLVTASKSHLKAAEHFLDHLEADGGTNTHDALREAIDDPDVESIYLLSDGEPTHGICETRDILNDVKVWLRRRKKPVQINAIAFLMGHHTNDPKPRQLMAQLASCSDGVYRCLDPHAHHDEMHTRDDIYDDSVFDQDDDFIDYFENKINKLPEVAQPGYNMEVPSNSSVYPLQSQNVYPLQSQNSGAPPYVQPVNFSNTYVPLIPSTSTMISQNQNQNLIQEIQVQNPLNSPLNYRMNAKRRTRNPLEISIIGATTILYPSKFTSYVIELDVKGIIPFKNVKWQAQHRFSEFNDFYIKMEPYVFDKGLQSLIQIPPKTIFRNFDRNFIEQRRLALQNFLRLMYTYFDPEENSEFDSFLLYDVYLNQAISQAEVVDMEQQFMQAQSQLMIQGQFGPPTAPQPDI